MHHCIGMGGGERWTDRLRDAVRGAHRRVARAPAHGSAGTASRPQQHRRLRLRGGGRPARRRRAPRGGVACRSRGLSSAPPTTRRRPTRVAHLRRPRRARAGAGGRALGPPRRCAWVVNGALRSFRGAAPRRGADDRAARVLRLAVRAGAPAALRDRGRPDRGRAPTWDGARAGSRARRLPLPSEPDARPLVAMVGLEARASASPRRLAELQREAGSCAAATSATRAGWTPCAAGRGVPPRARRVAVDNGLDVILRHTNALDGAVAFYISGQLVVPLAARPARVQPDHRVGASRARALLRDAHPTWLDPAASAALGVPARPARLRHPDRRRGRVDGAARLSSPTSSPTTRTTAGCSRPSRPRWASRCCATAWRRSCARRPARRARHL
jgi:hypothetical protein